MLPQLLKITPVSKEGMWIGFRFVVKGYFKKMVIADNLAPLVVAAFSSPEVNPSSLYWWGIMVAFAIQIYCDFAGYSDIARGLAKWMGYDFVENFNHPYISTSLRDFWTPLAYFTFYMVQRLRFTFRWVETKRGNFTIT